MSVKIWRPPITAVFSLDDTTLELIPLGPQHRQILVEAFGRLSERSRYYRFMAPISELSNSDLDYLTDLDMTDRFAWGLLVDDVPVAVGRYARTTTDPGAVEVGLAVLDDYQGRGYGVLLIETLAVVARSNGFSTMHFEVLAENHAMLKILDKLGVETESDGTIVHAELPLDRVPDPPLEADLLMKVVGSARSQRAP